MSLIKRIFILIIVGAVIGLSFPSNSKAQCPNNESDFVHFNLSGLTSPANLWRIEDILNIQIKNNADEDLKIRLIAKVIENGSELFVIQSSYFFLPYEYGNYVFVNPTELGSIEVITENSDRSDFVQEVIETTGSLPAGDYQICIDAEGELSMIIGHCCVDQYIEHPSPPELIYPTDESFVTEDLPIFSWLPPMPSYATVEYAIEIVEVLDGQTPIEAIDANYAWFEMMDIPVTSFQYPVANRGFINGARYAWRVGAIMGKGGSKESWLMSPVWSFVYQGSETFFYDEPYQVNLISPPNKDIAGELPFFEWDLTNPSAQTAETRVFDEDIYFDLRIWQWPDSLDAGEAGMFLENLRNNTQIDPWFEENDIAGFFYNIAEIAEDTLKNEFTYMWQVIGIKDEVIIAKSDINSFSFIADNGFEEAAESMLNFLDIDENSEIYGLIEPLTAGVIIESEEPSDIDSIEVKALSHLFIIDDEPWSRFGHPVRYVLVEKETKSVDVYNANWFPTLKNSDAPWKSTGTTNINENDIGLLGRGDKDEPAPERQPATIVGEALLSIKCLNNALIFDAGDKNRKGVANNMASSAARDADSMLALYEKEKYNILRFSQYWDNKNEDVKTIPVDPEARSAAKFIRESLLQLCEHYNSNKCCANSKLDFNLFIYINANALPSSSEFKVYKPDGSGIHENISYFEDILKHLQTLPQCVKITMFVDACFSGTLVNPEFLDSWLKRGNYEIITASDALKTTSSGVDRDKPLPTTENVDQLVRDISKFPVNRGNEPVKLREKSFTGVVLAFQNLSSQKRDVIDYAENIANIKRETKNIAKALNRDDPNPQYASLKQRYEDTLYFPGLSQGSKIKDFIVSPENAANIIPDKEVGKFVVFAKIKGEITVTIIFEDGTRKEKVVNSKWGDGT